MAAKEPAMRPTGEPLAQVLDRATGPRRAEVDDLLELHERISGQPPVVWAGRIVGFGEYEYRYNSGHGGRAPVLAFAPGASRHTIYLAENFATRWPDLVEQLGAHKASKACLYLTRLDKVDRETLAELLERSRQATLKEYPG